MKLEVPVGLFLTDNNQLLLKGNGISKLIDFPVKPFFLTEMQTGERVKLIGPNKEINIGKMEFQVMPFRESPTMKSEIPSFDFVTNLFREHPELMKELAGDDMDIYPQFMDIETYGSTGNNFNPAIAICIAIQVKYPDTMPHILIYNHPEYKAKMLNRYDTDKAVIKWYDTEEDLLRAYVDITALSPTGKIPDCITGYRNSVFDCPFILERMHILKIRKYMHKLAYYEKKVKGNTMNGGIYYTFGVKPESDNAIVHLFPGYIIFDLYHQVKKDMNKAIKQLPSKSLKKVAEVYGSLDVYDIDKQEKTNMLELLIEDSETFFKYAISDIVQTEYLYNIYSVRIKALCNLIKVPFLTTLFYSSGQISTTVLYRECRKNGYFSLDTNMERYPELCDGTKYEGATVECLKRGYFENIIYVDAHAMYPTIMYDFNTSYEKYIYHGYITYKEWKEKYKDTDMEDPSIIRSFGPTNARKIYIPDNNYQMVLDFTFDFTEEGFMKKMIRRYNNIRDQYKQEMKKCQKQFKETNDIQYKLESANWDARQQAAKVINNTFYGIQGNVYLQYADRPLAIFITALGRWQMEQISKLAGNSILEKDTDGIVVDLNLFPFKDVKDFTMEIKQKMSDLFGLDLNLIEFDMEFEGKGSLYLYEMKNYILRTDEDNKLTIKGVAFSGYNKTKVFHRTVDILSKTVMYGEYEGKKITFEEATKMALDIENLPMEYFLKTQSVHRDISDYSSYENIYNYSTNMENQPEDPKQFLKLAKARAVEWITTTKLLENTTKSDLKKRIMACSNENSFIVECNHIMTNKVSLKTSEETYFIKLMKRKKQLGYSVNIDDEIGFYYTCTSLGCSLAEETKREMLNMDKYYQEINSVIDTFSLVIKTNNLDDLDISGYI